MKRRKKIMIGFAVAIIFVSGVIYRIKSQTENSNTVINGIVVETYPNKIRIYTEDLGNENIVDAVIDSNSKLPEEIAGDRLDPLLYSSVSIQYNGEIAEIFPPFITTQKLNLSSVPRNETEVGRARKFYQNSAAYPRRSEQEP